MAWSPGAGRDDKGYQSKSTTTGTSSGRPNPHMDTGYSKPSLKSDGTKVTGDDFRRHAKRVALNTHTPKSMPSWVPTSIKAGSKILGGLFGDPKFDRRSRNKKRISYINNIKDPALRKEMIDKLGLAVDEDYDEGEDFTDMPGATFTLDADPLSYGKNLSSLKALDIINYDGEYMKKFGPKPSSDPEGNPNILPEYAMMGGGAELGGDDAVEDVTYDWHLGKGGQKTGRDVTLGYLASGGRARRAEGGIMGTRARKAFGGIMDRVTGRKAYGLGSIFKSVKKAVGKVLKSDIGKAAIIGAGIYYGGGGKFSKMFSPGETGFSWGLGNTAAGKGFFSKGNPLLFSGGEFNPWKMAGLITAGGAMMGPAKVDQLPGDGRRGGHLIDPITGKEALPSQMRASLNNALDNADGDPVRIKQINDAYAFLGPDERLGTYSPYRTYGVKDGGRIGKAEGGLMDLGGMEKDYRAEGGFVPIGAKEKADDVPARLSVNEFVFTADAVRNAGGGDIDQGAEVMENVMKNLEAGGKISAETQGNTGAQEMFSVSERLGEVI